MKKLLSIILVFVLTFSMCTVAFAQGNADELKFNSDGKFKIMQMNDIQDTNNFNSLTKEFMEKAIAQENPDLVVVVGDMLSDTFLFANEEKIEATLRTIAEIFEASNTPFAVTFGNHDHDLEDIVSLEKMIEIFKSYDCFMYNEGCDAGTYNLPILNSTGTGYALNVYLMDTNNKVDGEYDGVRPNQVQWYKDTSNALKRQNFGKVVPSVLFQHIPTKEMYQFAQEVDFTQCNEAIYNQDTNKWYKLDTSKIISDYAVLGEAPATEPLDKVTGQYEAWLEQGDIIGAFFGHDHVNNFIGVTDEGIVMGYNGGTGFRTYGTTDQRSVRIYEFNENDVNNYDAYTLTYKDVTGKSINFWFFDLFTPAIFGDIIRFLLNLIGLAK